MSKLMWSKEEREFLARIDWASCELAELWMIGGKRNPHRDMGEGLPSPDKNPIDDLITTTPRIVAAYYGYNATDPNEFGYSVYFDPRVRKALRDRISKAKRPQKVKKWSDDPRLASYDPSIRQMFDEVDWAKVDINNPNSNHCPLRVWAGVIGNDWEPAVRAKGMPLEAYGLVWRAADEVDTDEWHTKISQLREIMLDAIAAALHRRG